MPPERHFSKPSARCASDGTLFLSPGCCVAEAGHRRAPAVGPGALWKAGASRGTYILYVLCETGWVLEDAKGHGMYRSMTATSTYYSTRTTE